MNTTKHSEEIDISKVREAIKANQAIQKMQNQSKFKWHSNAVLVIKEKLEERKAKNLPNDWKPAFYEAKLKDKKSVLGKLSRLLK